MDFFGHYPSRAGLVYRLCQPDDRLCQIVEMDKKISYHAVNGFSCKTACYAITYLGINFQFCQKIPDSVTGIAGWGRLSENSNGAKFSPTGDGKIEANFQCNSHFMVENSNKNGIKSHRTLVFGQSGGVNVKIKAMNRSRSVKGQGGSYLWEKRKKLL